MSSHCWFEMDYLWENHTSNCQEGLYSDFEKASPSIVNAFSVQLTDAHSN